MQVRDIAQQVFHDLLSGFGLLSRLPMPQTTRHRPDALWTWPLVGVVLAGLALLPGTVLDALGAPVGAAAAITLGLSILLTGAMHEDGLADSADGLFGGWTRERRLEIMKDSRIGTYGTLALTVTLLMTWSLLTELYEAGQAYSVLAVAALSRAPMAVTMVTLTNARGGGLSAGFGNPSRAAVGVCCVCAMLIAWVIMGNIFVVLAMLAATLFATIAVAALAQKRIGGQTGDILGATQQMAFVSALLAAQLGTAQ